MCLKAPTPTPPMLSASKVSVRDAHVHLFLNEELNVNLLRLARSLNVERLYSSIYPFDLGDLNPKPEEVRKGNTRVAEIAEENREVVGLAFVNPLNPEDLREAERLLRSGFRGIGEVYRSVRPRGRIMAPIMELAQSFDVPVLIHVAHRLYPRDRPREGTPADVASLARKWPRVKVIMAHISGGGDWENALEEVRLIPNVYLDLGGSVCDSHIAERSVEALGADRVLFGSDDLLPQALARLEEAQLDQEVKVRIYRENAIRVFGD